MSRFCRLTLLALVLVVPSVLEARDTFHEMSVEKALGSIGARDKLLDVPVFMIGQPHAPVVEELGEYKANRRTNAFNKTDERACTIAFLSAIISLQSRAKSLGADAVIEIRSITKHRDLESATSYRCVAGNVVANVALTGKMVRFDQ